VVVLQNVSMLPFPANRCIEGGREGERGGGGIREGTLCSSAHLHNHHRTSNCKVG